MMDFTAEQKRFAEKIKLGDWSLAEVAALIAARDAELTASKPPAQGVKMVPGDMILLVIELWSSHAGECVIVTKADEDGKGFDFVIPEVRGHAPMKFVDKFMGHFDLDALGIKQK